MRTRLIAPLILGMLFALLGTEEVFAKQESAETADYLIDKYELTVETKAGSTSVSVTMDITYLIRSGTKATGFKYIGKHQPEGLAGWDGDGNAIVTSVAYERETRIDWSFPAASRGTRRVLIRFTLSDALTSGGRGSNEFEASWAGIFKVPVRNAVYRFVFPDTEERVANCMPANFKLAMWKGRRSVEVTQVPLKTAAFEVAFSPRIAEAASSAMSLGRDRSSGFPFTSVVIFGVGAAILVLVGVLAKKARRLRSKNAGSFWSMGSTCAGGSSCSSSSCGSSCGGGCGGGCGG